MKHSMEQINDEFRTLIGVVLYLSIRTRPHIATVVSILSRYTAKPTPFVMKCALCTGGYLKQTIHYGLPDSKEKRHYLKVEFLLTQTIQEVRRIVSLGQDGLTD